MLCDFCLLLLLYRATSGDVKSFRW